MGHHIHAVPPPLLQPMPKLERPRWRPKLRFRPDGTPILDEDATAETEEASAAMPGRPATPRQAAPAKPKSRRPAGPGVALSDDTLRTVLASQEALFDDAG